MPVHVHERRLKLAAAARELQAKLGRPATIEELADATKLELKHAEEALAAVEASVSLHQTIGNDGDGELGDLLADPLALDPVDEAADELRRQAVRAALEVLDDRERIVLERRFGFAGEQSLESIGKELKLTRERVRQLETSALRRLEHELGGIDLSDLPLAA